MSILVKPTMRCNSNCSYCYEDQLRKEGKFLDYDLDKVLSSMETAHKQFKTDICFHGGEILLLPKSDLERLFERAFELNGRSSIQTNGLLVDDEIIDMFKKYKTSVGLSIDGPDELNEGRWREKNKERTQRVIKNIYRMRYEKISVGLISVITKHNCLPPQRQKFKDWILEMKGIGCPSGRMNPVMGDSDCTPTIKELKEFYLDMCDFILEDEKLQWQPFRDVIDNLMGYRQSTCIYHQCDYFWTNSAHVILGDGEVRNCMKTVLGHNVFQGKEPIKIRYEALFNTPKEYDGCKGCRYWAICSGLCPSEGIDGDWRNKSAHCEVFYALYEKIEKRIRGLFPRIKLATDYKPEKPSDSISDGEFCKRVERLDFSTWRQTCPSKKTRGREPEPGHGDSHGDYNRHQDGNAPQPVETDHRDKPHGDYARHEDSSMPVEAKDADHKDSPHKDHQRHGDSG